MSVAGEHLFQLVQAYAALGVHRTGTAIDQATLEWFATALCKRGARVDTVPYRFERYVTDCRLMAHTSEVEVLPLYYEAAGKVHSSRLYLTELAIVANLNAPQLAAEALTGPMTPPGQRVQTLNPPGSEVGPGRVATWGKATVNRVEALGLKWEADGKSSKHIPFDWSGPEQG